MWKWLSNNTRRDKIKDLKYVWWQTDILVKICHYIFNHMIIGGSNFAHNFVFDTDHKTTLAEVITSPLRHFFLFFGPVLHRWS